MSTNKHAAIRYHALDKCFSNFGRKFYMEDLIDACNESLYTYAGILDGVKRRQVFEDIKFMESDQGWSVPLEKHKDGKKVYYRYDDKKYSIKNQSINEIEAKQLKETLSILTRFKGMPQFDWMHELLARVETSLMMKPESQPIVGFEQNPFLKGMQHFDFLFNAIQNHLVIEVTYKSFRSESEDKHILHPYYLKQFNSRWFLFGLNPAFDALSNFPLDRIIDVTEVQVKYVENTNIDFESYFEDIVGVTVLKDIEPEVITIEVENSYFPYLETKPIHGSQKIKVKQDITTLIQLELVINYELIALLFSMADNIKIISPLSLKEKLREKAEKLFLKYQ